MFMDPRGAFGVFRTRLRNQPEASSCACATSRRSLLRSRSRARCAATPFAERVRIAIAEELEAMRKSPDR
jgi:hypothetical protein